MEQEAKRRPESGAQHRGARGQPAHEHSGHGHKAWIVMCCVKESATNQGVAKQVGVSQSMVGKWRRRFVEHRMNGLSDYPRPGAPRKITDDQVEAAIVKTPEEEPKDAAHWSTRSMATQLGIEPDHHQPDLERVRAPAPPHRTDSFQLSTDPLFVDKVRDVVGRYFDPLERAVVLCADEKAQIQALNRFQPTVPMMPATPSAAATTMCATAPPSCSPPWT